jgi:hypothetical protein
MLATVYLRGIEGKYGETGGLPVWSSVMGTQMIEITETNRGEQVTARNLSGMHVL